MDALSTLKVMGMEAEFAEALAFVKTFGEHATAFDLLETLPRSPQPSFPRAPSPQNRSTTTS